MIDVGSGPPLVLIPGVQGRWEWLKPAVDALQQHFRIITFSLAGDHGSGRSFDPACGFDNYLNQIEEVLIRARLTEAAICGVSFGGLIALYWAARRPKHTQSLILASTPPPRFMPDWRIRCYLRAPRALSVVFATQAPFRLGPEIWAAFDNTSHRLAFSLRHLVRITRAPFSASRMAERAALLGAVDFEAECQQVSAPTLVVTGEASLDRVVSVTESQSYADLIAGAQHRTLENTGHIGLVTQPQRFAELLRQFVAHPIAKQDTTSETSSVDSWVSADVNLSVEDQ